MNQMAHPTILLTRPNGDVKHINTGYPGLVDAITDTRSHDRLVPEDAYVQAGWMRRCVDVRSDALASIPYTLRNKESGEIVYDSSGFNPLPDELAWLSDLELLLKLTEASLTLAGAAYWLPIVKRGRPRRVDWISPSLMEPKYNDSGEIVAYKRTLYVPQDGFYLPKESVIDEKFVTAFFARDPYTEVGPGNPVASSIRVNADVLHSLDIFLDQYMDRGLLPATIIAVPANTPPEERNRFQQWWDRYYRGKLRAGTQKVLNADSVKIEKIGDGIGQLGTSDVVKQQREAIASGLGVPMSRLLPGGGDKGSNLKDNEQFYLDTLIPSAKRIQVDLNRNLLDDYGLYFRFEFKRIEALQRANLETARTVQRLVEKPVLTQNEARLMLGYEEVDDEGADDLKPVESKLSQEASSLAVEEASTDPEQRGRTTGDEEEDQKPRKALAENNFTAGLEILKELEAWKKKAHKKGRDVEFIAHFLPPLIQAEIKSRLALPEDLEPLDRVFDPPFVRL